ncbi:MAG: rod shape-determining protein MreC [Verrucomicrobiales bacterium]|jgi:rod shape-determining protein MreC
MSRVNIISVVVVLLAIVWMFMLSDEAVYGIQQRALKVASPFIKARHQIQEAGSSLSKPKLSYQELEDEYERLLKELAQRQIQTQAMDRINEENSDLRKALQFRKGSAFNLTAAEVIGRETSTWYHTMVINKGSDHGVTKDSPVVVPLGLVGKVTLVQSTTSVVLLLTDEACKVASRVDGTSQEGIVEGDVNLSAGAERLIMVQGDLTGERGAIHSGPTLRLRYLEKSARNITKNMEVRTSGQGGIFPPDLELGSIVDVIPGDITSEAIVKSHVNFETLKFVFVIIGEKE